LSWKIIFNRVKPVIEWFARVSPCSPLASIPFFFIGYSFKMPQRHQFHNGRESIEL
jgi:hypothetical protein